MSCILWKHRIRMNPSNKKIISNAWWIHAWKRTFITSPIHMIPLRLTALKLQPKLCQMTPNQVNTPTSSWTKSHLSQLYKCNKKTHHRPSKHARFHYKPITPLISLAYLPLLIPQHFHNDLTPHHSPPPYTPTHTLPSTGGSWANKASSNPNKLLY